MGQDTRLPTAPSGKRKAGSFAALRRVGTAGKPRLVLRALIILLLLQMFIAMWLAAGTETPTFDEPSHIAAGAAYIQLHDLRWSPVHPPLARLLAGMPLAAAGIEVPDHGSTYDSLWDYELGREILYKSGRDPQDLLRLARLPLIVLTLGFGLAAYGFARDLFGNVGGLLALGVFSLDPNLSGHGHLATTDLPVAGFLLISSWMLWRARHGGLTFVALSAVAFGMALTSKFTALALLPVFVVLAMVPLWRSRGRLPAPLVLKLLRRAAGYVAIAFCVVWAVYLAIDPRQRFDRTLPPLAVTHDAASGPLAIAANLLPLPAQYRYGLVFNVRTDQEERAAFIAGRHYSGGWVAFYPLALALKTPCTHILLWGTAVVLIVRRRERWAKAVVLGPPAVFLAFAMTSNTNIGLRHVLVVPTFMAVACGAVALQFSHRLWRALALALLAVSALSVWHQRPLDLSYVSDVAGGRSAGRHLFTDSNIDWGQDLSRLASYLRRRSPREPVWLAYFGTVDAREYGIEARDPTSVPADEIHGTVAVSISRYNESADALRWLKDRAPTDLVGGSILVFNLP